MTWLLVLLALLPGIGYGRAYLEMFSLPGNIDPFTDATTYLAAGERLNAGHSLYALSPDDRPVLIVPGQFSAPLVSPPTIAVLWRPLAAVQRGFGWWLAGVWISLLGTVAYLTLRTRWIGVIAGFVLAEAIGNQLAVANVTAFFPLVMILAWNYRRHPAIAVLVALMTALKIAPGALFGWNRIGHARSALTWAAGAGALLLVMDLAFAGVGNTLAYAQVAMDTSPSPMSLSGLTGLPWLSNAVLIIGTVIAFLISDQRLSFVIAVITVVAGTPALYAAGLVPLLAVLAPAAEVRFDETRLLRTMRSRRLVAS